MKAKGDYDLNYNEYRHQFHITFSDMLSNDMWPCGAGKRKRNVEACEVCQPPLPLHFLCW